jgi:hypothetical protein
MPFHQGRDISPTLLRQIAKDIGLSVDDFIGAQSGQQPDKALQAAAGKPAAPKKPPEPDRD